MKINNFFIPDKIQKNEKSTRKIKTSFSDFLSNEVSEIDDVSSLEQISSIDLDMTAQRNFVEERKAYQTSKKALEKLEELRDEIANGITNLNDLVSIKESIYMVEKSNLNQPLRDVIEEIELKVEVEIAKIEQSLKTT
jgi:hypothetical protein